MLNATRPALADRLAVLDFPSSTIGSDRLEAVISETSTLAALSQRCATAYRVFGVTTDMPIKATPFGCLEKLDWGADIHSVAYDGRLSIRVLRNRNNDDGIEVTFVQVDGFRFLDEVLLAEYWIADDFPSGFPVLEVFAGGWAEEEDKRLGYTRQQREWIVAMAGACVSVLSNHEPVIRDAVWPAKP